MENIVNALLQMDTNFEFYSILRVTFKFFFGTDFFGFIFWCQLIKDLIISKN